jgi:cytochrome c biogenesis protein CcdA/thiol-disulfide isomerase/thioredoxin
VALLMLFALLAGAGTALSPCVLPVLPAVLSVGVTGGRRRPLGVVVGLAASFTFATVALVYVLDALGLPDDLLRTLAIVTLFAFGILLVVPPLADRMEAWVSRLVPGPARGGGEGFGSGLLLGASLGLVYAPCAGPILAGVITVSASQDFTGGKLAVAISYAIGSVAVLYLLMIGGRRLADRLKAYRGRIQMAMGVVMIATAVAMSADLDVRFQTAIADDLPGFLVNPTAELEESSAVADELADVRGGGGAQEAGASEAASGSKLPELGAAPELAEGNWFNTPGDEPLTLSELQGENRVVLIDFWTYTCINCIRTLPYVTAWDSKYRDEGLTVIGVHSPEFSFEKEASNVEDAIADNDIDYPVVQDNELATWSAFDNQYWPAKYLIDANGEIRYTHFGEGDYEQTEAAIRSLLAEAGDKKLGKQVGKQNAEVADPALRTPETYIGWQRAQGYFQPPHPGVGEYTAPAERDLLPNAFALGGRWQIDAESGTALSDATITVRFKARRVFLVMGSPGRPRDVRVELDGKPIPDSLAGEDVHGGKATISDQRLYRLVELPEAGDHTLTLRFDLGIEAFAFTFG